VTASNTNRCRAIGNARTYAGIANRALTITPMLIANAVILKLLIREAGGVLMTHNRARQPRIYLEILPLGLTLYRGSSTTR